MQSKRRSGRIAKELAIVLFGTDAAGKVFSEETKTVVLSRHGAGVVSRYRFAPDEVLTLRLPGTTQEALVRLVGQIGGEPGRYVYGLAFLDPDPHFWPMEFPPPDPHEPVSRRITLECSFCLARQDVEQGDIEEDVYSVLGNVLRYCPDCGTSTPWKKALIEAVPVPAASPAEANFRSVPSYPAPRVSPPHLASPAPSFAASFEPPHVASSSPDLASPAASYSGASALQEFVSVNDPHASPHVASAVAVLQVPDRAPALAPPSPQLLDAPARQLDANGRRINKRRHVRIRVNFSACVRRPAHADEIVECENISKGGMCFHSLTQYALGSLIEVAAPFSPGEQALFVPAQIKRVEPLSGSQVFRYGVEYTFLPSSQQS
ncbi:MAG: PilZ domain-containing protein [Candidatus Acidiferrum sp.]